ncbi:MAG: DUF6252 family protein [Chitinophagaceae bacterium]
MKKLLFSALFLSTIALGFSSCMNGDYDANPLTTNTTINPIKPVGGSGNGGGNGGGGGGSVGIATKGQIRCVVSGGSNFVSSPASNYQVTGNDILITGGVLETTLQRDVDLYISGYTGVGTYTCSGTSSTSTHGSYSVETLGSGSTETFNTATSTPQGSGTITVVTDANNELIGTFSFTAYSDKDGSKSVTITNGSFDVPKF